MEPNGAKKRREKGKQDPGEEKPKWEKQSGAASTSEGTGEQNLRGGREPWCAGMLLPEQEYKAFHGSVWRTRGPWPLALARVLAASTGRERDPCAHPARLDREQYAARSTKLGTTASEQREYHNNESSNVLGEQLRNELKRAQRTPNTSEQNEMQGDIFHGRTKGEVFVRKGTDVPFEAQECKPTQAHLGEYIAVKVKKKKKEKKRKAQQQNAGRRQKVPQGRTVSERRKTIKETYKVTATTRTRQYDSELERKIRQILKQKIKPEPKQHEENETKNRTTQKANTKHKDTNIRRINKNK
ncbi:hypothetical protein WN51_04090 [Melipona quadrifasciata]|uniref:Uncharacterized protein n=1 Tax=Melipona quadrifasciata TaxID=166423 RepID=A0A0N0BC74_9HYME|nr:hypothetical protein WN51_04090 [Melipona quadrifasciata]